MNQYIPLLVLFAITWILIWVCFSVIMNRIRGNSFWSRNTDKSSSEILNVRYAKGEITEPELREKKTNMNSDQ